MKVEVWRDDRLYVTIVYLDMISQHGKNVVTYLRAGWGSKGVLIVMKVIHNQMVK